MSIMRGGGVHAPTRHPLAEPGPEAPERPTLTDQANELHSRLRGFEHRLAGLCARVKAAPDAPARLTKDEAVPPMLLPEALESCQMRAQGIREYLEAIEDVP